LNVVIVLAREDAEVHLHALQTMTEQIQLCEWEHCSLGKLYRYWEIIFGSWDVLITQAVHVLPCSKSTTKDNNGTNRILYHDTAAQTITEPPVCFTVGTRISGLQASFGVLEK
jgi:hypothetical protein